MKIGECGILETRRRDGFRKEETESPESDAAAGSRSMTDENSPSGTGSGLSGVEG